MIPGNNLLAQALTVIAPSQVIWYKFVGRTQNSVRQWVSEFAIPKPLLASVQAVPRSRYEALGLDFQKQYINIFTLSDISSVERDSAGDQFVWNCQRYEVPSGTDWKKQDGWMEILAIYIGPEQ